VISAVPNKNGYEQYEGDKEVEDKRNGAYFERG
jgi:hypothetical protein